MIFMVTGDSGSGKTRLLEDLIGLFRKEGLVAGGFTAPGTWADGRRSGFNLRDTLGGVSYFLAGAGIPGDETFGRFGFDGNTLRKGNQLLMEQSGNRQVDIITIDEVGPLELMGGGWAPSLDLLCKSQKPQIWVVRKGLVEQVPEKWGFVPGGIFAVPECNAVMVFNAVRELINRKS